MNADIYFYYYYYFFFFLKKEKQKQNSFAVDSYSLLCRRACSGL